MTVTTSHPHIRPRHHYSRALFWLLIALCFVPIVIAAVALASSRLVTPSHVAPPPAVASITCPDGRWVITLVNGQRITTNSTCPRGATGRLAPR